MKLKARLSKLYLKARVVAPGAVVGKGQLMEQLAIWRHDTLPPLELDVVDFDGTTETAKPLDADGLAVRLKMRPLDGGALKIDALFTMMDAVNGKVQYDWLPADTDTVGEWLAEVTLETPPVTIVDKGAWSNVTTYATNDRVSYGGSYWLAKRINTAVTPAEGPDWTAYVPKQRTIKQFQLTVLEDLQ